MLLVLTSLIVMLAQAQSYPEVVSIRKIELKDGVDAAAYQKDVQNFGNAIGEHSDGAFIGLLKGDRGERKGQLLLSWVFARQSNRDFYFPSADAEDYPNLAALLEKAQVQMEMPDSRVKDGAMTYTDYVTLGFEQMDNPQGGNVYAVREFEVKSGKDAAFDKFIVSEYYPALNGKAEGLSFYVMKGDRGERKGKYMMVYAFDTVERRNSYFPKEGGDASAEFAEAMKDVPNFNEKMAEFLAEGTGSSYTDYVVIP